MTGCERSRAIVEVAAVVDEIVEELENVFRGRVRFRALSIRDAIENIPELLRLMAEMIVQAPDHVAAVTRKKDVLCLGRHPQRIGGKMRLDETPMLLRPEHLEDVVERDEAHVEPGREIHGGNAFGAIEYELGHDLLRPRRT